MIGPGTQTGLFVRHRGNKRPYYESEHSSLHPVDVENELTVSLYFYAPIRLHCVMLRRWNREYNICFNVQ
jgi:hypothetical protein